MDWGRATHHEDDAGADVEGLPARYSGNGPAVRRVQMGEFENMILFLILVGVSLVDAKPESFAEPEGRLPAAPMYRPWQTEYG